MSTMLPPNRVPPAPSHAPLNAGGGFRAGRPDADSEPTAKSVNLKDVIAVVRRHVWLVLAVAVLTTLATAALVYMQDPVYRASTVIRLVDSRSAVTGGLDDAAVTELLGGPSVDPLLSQTQVMRSRAVIGEVVDREGLRLLFGSRALPDGLMTGVEVNPDATVESLGVRFGADGVTVEGAGQTVQAAYGEPVRLGGVSFTANSRPAEFEEVTLIVLPRQSAVLSVLDRLRVRIREKTNVIDVEYSDTDPDLAQRTVNAVTEVFRDYDARIAQQQSLRRRSFVEEQLRQTDSLLTEAQQAYTNFRSREQVFSSRERFAAEQEGLLQLEVRRRELEADRAMFGSLQRSLANASGNGTRQLRALISSPDIAANPVIQGLTFQLAEQQAVRDSMTVAGSPATSPEVQQVNALIAGTQGDLVEAIQSHVDALDARIAALGDLETRSGADLSSMPTTESAEARLLRQVETVRTMADQLREEYQKAKISEAVQAGQVEIVDDALLPTRPVGTGPMVKILVGLVFGLFLGSGGAFLLEHVNSSIRRRDELEEHLGVTGLAVIPRFEHPGASIARTAASRASANGAGYAGDAPADLVVLHDGGSPTGEAFRTLRTNLIFSQSVEAIRALVVTSATPSEGKTTTIANLAVSFAQQGKRVLLIDCDLRRPRLHSVFGIPKEPGLTNLVLGHKTADEVIRASIVPNLSLLTSGTLPPNPSEFLGGAAMRASLDTLMDEFDMVLIDAPPVLAASDAAILGRYADGVLFVVRAGQTDRAEARHAVRELMGVGARIIGAVLNDPDSKVPRSGEGGYYAYSYENGGRVAKV